MCHKSPRPRPRSLEFALHINIRAINFGLPPGGTSTRCARSWSLFVVVPQKICTSVFFFVCQFLNFSSLHASARSMAMARQCPHWRGQSLRDISNHRSQRDAKLLFCGCYLNCNMVQGVSKHWRNLIFNLAIGLLEKKHLFWNTLYFGRRRPTSPMGAFGSIHPEEEPEIVADTHSM